MGAGWIAHGPDTPAPASDVDPWKPIGPDTSDVPSLVRPHQDVKAHPVDNTRGLFTRAKDTLFGHEPSPGDTDQAHVPGLLPAVGVAAKNLWDQGSAENLTRGPALSTLATAYPHLVGADVQKVKAGYQEAYGTDQVQRAERTLAALNVLPQVAARTRGSDLDPTVAMSKDPLVDKTARKLGLSPQEFAGDWGKYSGYSREEQADLAARAQDTLAKGKANLTAGGDTRLSAWATERAWQPADLANGKLDPMSLKGLAFNLALTAPQLAAVTGAAVAGGAVGGPGGAMAAGAGTAAALFAPAQRSDARNQIDDQVSRLMEKAHALDQQAQPGNQRALNPITTAIRQQAADLEANGDRIANTAGFLYAVGDAAGALPVSTVLSRTPGGKAVMDRIVGAAVGKTVGGRIAGSMVANGAGGVVQGALQKAVDAGIVHENTSLSDALKDIAYTGLMGALTAAPIAAVHEAAGAPERARVKRNLDSDELRDRVKAATDAMGAPKPAEGESIYPGYRWDDNAQGGRGGYVPTGATAQAAARRLGGPDAAAPAAAGGPQGPAPAGPAGMAGTRHAFQAKIDALNTAAAAAEKRTDVTLEPEEEGWSVHVKGQPIATFDTVGAAREAMAQARKVVGTKPATPETKAPIGETKGPSGATEAPIRATTAPEPETALERTQPIQPERRSRPDIRQRVDQMNPEQLKAALLTHELTGIPNRRAYEESAKKPAQVSIDVDSLKWINDHASHDGGDQLLKSVAQALHEETGGNAYHISGDEFVVQGDSHEHAEGLMQAAKARLNKAELTFAHPDGRTITLSGIGLSHGTGTSLEEAEGHLHRAKEGREAAGLRSARGEQPPNARSRPGEAGVPAGGGEAPAQVNRAAELAKEIAAGIGGGTSGVNPVNPHAKVLGKRVEIPDVPTAAQAKAGNYFKPSVDWHGIPIKVENTKGQMRPYIDAVTGKPGRRKMRADYGYVPGTKGADADGVDIMMGPHPEVQKAWVIDQLNGKGTEFDEHKIQVGVRSEAEAREQYLSHYPQGWKGLGAITELSAGQLKRWLKEGDLRQPLSPDAVPAAKVQRGTAPNPHHDSILEYLARHPRGLDRAEAQAQGIDPADMGLTAAHVGIRRAFRKNGLSFDHAAEALHEAGYPVADAQGRYSPNVLLDRIDDELKGKKHYSHQNVTHTPESKYARDWRHPVSDAELAAMTAAETQERLAALEAEERRLEREGMSEPAESEEDLDRIPFAKREELRLTAPGGKAGAQERKPAKAGGEQQDLFGDKVAVQNEIARLKTALDAKRTHGQTSAETGRPDDLFSQSRRQRDLVKEGETRYSVHEPPKLKGARAKRAAAVRQMDIFANMAMPRPAVEAARLAQSVHLRHIGEFRSGLQTVKTWQDAAHILAPLRKNPQEHMVALVLDQANKPIAVIRHTIGVSDGASVEPWSLAGGIAQVPGAASVYFAHNHPSGVSSQSQADHFITQRLHNLLGGTGIEPKGMIVVAPGSKTASHFMPDGRGGEGLEIPGAVTPAARSGMVPMVERRFAVLRRNIGPISGLQASSPALGKQAVEASGEKSGVLLLNKRHAVVGVVPMSEEEMLQLRSGDPTHGAGRLLKAMSEANAGTLISFGSEAAARNVAVFGNASGARAVDAIHREADGSLVSLGQYGEMPQGDAFLKRGAGTGGGMEVGAVRAQIHGILKGFGIKPQVTVVDTLADLADHPEVGHIARDPENAGAVAFVHPRTNKIYLVADQMHGPDAVASALAHEYVTHFGLRAAFGDRRSAQYQAILDGVARALPAELRTRGEQAFPEGFNPLNRHQRNIAAEEVLAYYGQEYAKGQSVPDRIRRWLDKMLGMIRDWVRRVLGLPKKFDELFVKRTLADLESFLRRGESTRAGPSTEGETAFAGHQDTFYSGLAKAVDAAKREKGTGAEWEATLKNMPGVKAEELQWTGLKDWLEGRGRVSKDEVAGYVHAHRVQLGESIHGEEVPPDTPTRQSLSELAEQFEYSVVGSMADAGGNNEQVHVEPWEILEEDVRPTPTASAPYLEEWNRLVAESRANEQPGPARDRIEEAMNALHKQMVQATIEEKNAANAGAQVPSELAEAVRRYNDYQKVKSKPTKYAQYTTPGGTHYRELLLTLPRRGSEENIRLKSEAAQKRLRAETEARAADKAVWEVADAKLHKLPPRDFFHMFYAVGNEGSAEGASAQLKIERMIDSHTATWRPHVEDAVTKAVEAGKRLRQAIGEEVDLRHRLEDTGDMHMLQNRLTRYRGMAEAAGQDMGAASEKFFETMPNISQLDRANGGLWLSGLYLRGHEDGLTDLGKLDRLMESHNVKRGPEYEAALKASRAFANAVTNRDQLAERLRNMQDNTAVRTHWDEPNVVAHTRFDDRVGPSGEKILHINEIQSDWHQKGRKFGYLGGADEAEPRAIELTSRLAEITRQSDALAEDRDPVTNQMRDESAWHRLRDEHEILRGELERLEAKRKARVPDAPFKTTWPELVLKRMLRYAAEHGYDALTWDTGQTNAERFNLSQIADKLSYAPDVGHLQAFKNGARTASHNQIGVERLADYVGEEVAARLLAAPADAQGYHTLAGTDLKVGGMGMRAFYDKMLPAAVGKMVKKWGTKVEPGVIPGEVPPAQYFGPELTPNQVRARIRLEMPVQVREQLRDVSAEMERGLNTKVAMEAYGSPAAAEAVGGQMLEPHKAVPMLRRWLDDYAAQHELKVAPTLHSAEQIELQEQSGTYAMVPEEILDKVDQHNILAQVTGLRERVPTHMVRLTPALRDSVLGGQPMFLKRRKPSSGEETPQPKRGAYNLARRAVAAIPKSELNQSLRRIVDPAGVSDVAGATALRFRESLGELAQAREEAVRTLEDYAKQFDLLGTQDRYDFIDDMEEGRPQRDPSLQPAADAIRKLLDDWRERIRGLGVGALDNFIEHYFPHIWQDEKGAKAWLGKVMGRRPLKGPASFLKERTIPTTREGLEAGLTPISTNPLILAFAKLAEMMKFYHGVKFVQELKDEKLAVFKPWQRRMPDDWVKIEDAVGRVMQWSEAEQGFIERGHYIMPADAGRIVNNHLGASALRNFLPAQLFRVLSNAANALQLGFSGFHLGFTTLDAIVSRNAIGIERLLHGEPLRAAQAFLEAATGPGAALANIARGHALRRAYGNPEAASPAMQRIVQALEAAGGRIKMDRYFQAAQGISPFHGVGFVTLAKDVRAALTQPSGKVMEATKVLGSFPLQYATKLWRDLEAAWTEMPMPALTVPIEMAGRVTRASTSIIMEHIVPLQKLGVFSDLAADHIRRNPGEDSVAFASAMQKIWDSVDNRLGEMVYDNLFWNRTFKDVNHMMIRAVGWNLGTVRELGGAPIDVVKLLDYMARGAPAELEAAPLGHTAQARLDYEKQKSRLHRIAEKVGHKIPYTLALVGTTMVAGAILQYLLTGEGPTEVKDYFFPWTGRMTKYGTKERISLPSYMKDIYEYSTQPATTVINKANPIFGIIHAIYANEDFFGNPVRDPDASIWRQIIQGAQYGAREVLPFSLQGGRQFAGAGEMDAKGKILAGAPYFGLTPAPARVTSPEQMERYQLRETEKGYIRGLQRRLRGAADRGDKEEVDRLRDEIRTHKLKERETEHAIRTDKIKAREASATGLDTAKYALPANDPAQDPATWGRRADGSPKGPGFLGLLKRPDGRVSSEISIGVEIDGRETEIPTMVPTLNQSELDFLMTHDVAGGEPIPHPIIQKAIDYARERIGQGKSPFAGPADHADTTAAKISQLVDGKARGDQVAALHAAGLPAFAELWRSLPARPRDRVAASLEAFG